jgi:hypothetical protein
MYFHIFGFRWKPGVTEQQKGEVAAAILAFQGPIDGLLEVHVGPNDSPRGQGYEFAGVMRFTDKAAVDAYTVHPQHEALLKWLLPLIEAVELDFLPIG